MARFYKCDRCGKVCYLVFWHYRLGDLCPECWQEVAEGPGATNPPPS